MRELIFKQGNELVIIRIENAHVTFAKMQGQYFRYSTIEGLKLSPSGILKEFPDLKDLNPEEMRVQAIKRFKSHILELRKDELIEAYIVKDLKPHGYVLMMRKMPGFRPERMN